MATVSVVGVGYVGLVTAAGFAHLGHDVTCIDTDQFKIDQLRQGQTPIFEAGLGDLLVAGIAAGRLRFQTAPDDTSAASDFHFVCVPTPAGPDGSADLTFLEDALVSLRPFLKPGAVVVNKSTVPVGTTDFVDLVLERNDVSVVSNPEFLREGSAVHDFLNPDRVVIGTDDSTAADKVRTLYEQLDATVVVTDPRSAELIKYGANAFLAMRLSFVNAMAGLCEDIGADSDDVVLGIGLDHRVGLDYFTPGPGWGGSCFPKDTRTMIHLADQAGYDFTLVRAALEVNEQRLDRVANKVLAQLRTEPRDATVGILGLAFKAETDDTRMSPALAVIERLHTAGVGSIRVADPVARLDEHTPAEQVATEIDAARGADVIVVMTEWSQYKTLDLAAIAAAMAGDTVVDTRGIIDVEAATGAGLHVERLGRKS